MPSSPTSRDDLEGFLRTLSTKMERLERHTHNLPVPAKPAPAPAPPFVPPPEPDCAEFEDDFERTTIGPDWQAGVLNADIEESHLPTIADGDVIGPAEDFGLTGFIVNEMMTTASLPGGQFIEILVSDYHQGYYPPPLGVQHQIIEGQWWLYCQANDVNQACIGVNCEFFINDATSSELYGQVFAQDAAGVFDWSGPETDPAFSVGIGWPDNSPKLLRLEVTDAGHVTFLCDGVTLIDADVDPVVGDRVGFAFNWHHPNYDGAGPGDPLYDSGGSFHVPEVSGGCLTPPTARRRIINRPGFGAASIRAYRPGTFEPRRQPRIPHADNHTD
jgi:hypothetical protein